MTRLLLEIAGVCDKVPYEPAETFREAVQAVWFIQLILQIESNGHSLSYGRFDQYVYPYLASDLEKGIITEDQAVELLTNLWIKTLTINKVRSQAHTFSSAGSPMYQNVTIGGQTADGKDAVNKLSFLILRSIGQTRLPQPNLTVRYHRNINQAFMDEAIEVLKLGTGMPAFNNDEVIIPSFIEGSQKRGRLLLFGNRMCGDRSPRKMGLPLHRHELSEFPAHPPHGHEQWHRCHQRQEVRERLWKFPEYGVI